MIRGTPGGRGDYLGLVSEAAVKRPVCEQQSSSETPETAYGHNESTSS